MSNSKLFTPDGWLNVPYIESVTGYRYPYRVIVGQRQIGKTYGVTQHVLNRDEFPLYLRRKVADVDKISEPMNSPFFSFTPTVSVTRDRDSGVSFFYETPESEEPFAMAMSAYGDQRGLNLRVIDTIVYDEFIAPLSATRRKGEALDFANLCRTVTSVRELQGKPPVTVWLLANSNSIDNPVLKALGIQNDLAQMTQRHQTEKWIPRKGIYICNVDNSPVAVKLASDSVSRAFADFDEFTGMAEKNEFVLDDYTGVASQPLYRYRAICKGSGITVWKHKWRSEFYVIGGEQYPVRRHRAFKDDATGRRLMWKYLQNVLWTVEAGKTIFFDSITTKIQFFDVMPEFKRWTKHQ